MNNEQQIQDTLKLANELSGKLDQLMNQTNSVLQGLPVEEQGKLAFISQDINGIMKAVRNGDMSKMNDYINKYADSSKR